MQKSGLLSKLRTSAARVGGQARRLGRDERGGMALQMIFLSFVLFGTTGLVVDTGILYSTHSQMQAYADQVALAAAAELDNEADSIERATKAGFGITSGTPTYLFDAGVGGTQFAVQEMVFYSDYPDDAVALGVQFDLRDLDGEIPGAGGSTVDYRLLTATDTLSSVDPGLSESAEYVAVRVEPVNLTSITAAIANFGSQVLGGIAGVSGRSYNTGYSVGTIAMAGLEEQTCADLSTLVFCNPWEERSGFDLDTVQLERRSMQFFAPNFDSLTGVMAPDAMYNVGSGGGNTRTARSEYNGFWHWDIRNQLFKMVNPISDPSNVCSLEVLQSYLSLPAETETDPVTGLPVVVRPAEDVSSESAVDFAAARDRCLLARANAERVCFEDTISIQPVSGTTVLRSLTTIFDIFHEPFRTMLALNPDAFSAGVSVSPTSTITLADFFLPDLVVSTPFEALGNFGDTDGDGTFFEDEDYAYQHAWPAIIDRPFYNAVPGPGYTTINNRPADPVTGAPSVGAQSYDFQFLWGTERCHQNWQTAVQIAGINATSADLRAIEASGCTVPYVGNLTTADTTTLINMFSGLLEYYGVAPTFGELLTFTTWYDAYVWERANIGALRAGIVGRSIYHAGADFKESPLQVPAPFTPPALPDIPPGEFAFWGGKTALLTSGERRVMRSAMVNCMEAVDGGVIDGAYEAEVAKVIDVYLTRPPEHHCGYVDDNVNGLLDVNPTEIPIGCAIEEALETRLHVQVVEDVTDNVLTRRFTPELVR